MHHYAQTGLNLTDTHLQQVGLMQKHADSFNCFLCCQTHETYIKQPSACCKPEAMMPCKLDAAAIIHLTNVTPLSLVGRTSSFFFFKEFLEENYADTVPRVGRAVYG